MLQPLQHSCFSPSSVLPGPESPDFYPLSLNSRSRLSGAVLVSELLHTLIAWLALVEDLPEGILEGMWLFFYFHFMTVLEE